MARVRYMKFIIKYQWLYWFIDLQREVRFSESFWLDLHYKMIFIYFVFDEKSSMKKYADHKRGHIGM